MSKVILIVSFLFFVAPVCAQYSGYELMKDTTMFRQKFTATAKTINTISSDFIQEKNLSMLSEKITSSGKFWFKKSEMVRMEYLKPYKYLLVINKNNVTIKDSQKTNNVSAKSNKLFRQISRITVDCVQGNVFSNPDFKIKIFESSGTYLVEMSPNSKGLKDFFKSINIVVSKVDYSVTQIDMVEPSGDNTLMTFKNREINKNISDAIFTVQ